MRTALTAIQELRKGLRTERGEDVEIAKEIDLLLADPRFCAFCGTIELSTKETEK